MEQGVNHYKGKLRVRACGLCVLEDKLLLVRHQGLGETGIFWSPPGGGAEFGESITDALIREFMEETRIAIDVKEFLFIHEFITEDLHALELFFKVDGKNKNPSLGYDPEIGSSHQLLKEIKLFTSAELDEIPENQKHQIFARVKDFNDLFEVRGFFKSQNNSIK